MLTEKTQEQVRLLFSRYPKKAHAILPMLNLIQQEKGYISTEFMKYVAQVCEVPISHVQSVVTFYTMYTQNPRGRNCLFLCTNIACWIKGADKLLEYIENKLDVHRSNSTKDDKFYIEEVECLGACGYAPVLICNDEYHEELTTEKVDEIIDKCE